MCFKSSLLSLLFLLSISSCKVSQVTTVKSFRSKNVEKIALVGTYLGRIKLPIIPLIDAPIFNKKTNDLSDQIMSMQSEKIKKIEEVVATTLAENLNVEVVRPSDFDKPGLNILKERYSYVANLAIDDPNYFRVVSSTPDFNFFPFTNGEVLTFFENPNFKILSEKICEHLGVDAYAIYYSRLVSYNVRAFGAKASIRLDSHFFIIDNKGEVLTQSKVRSYPYDMKGNEIKSYERALNTYPALFEWLCKDIVGGSY